MALYLSFRKHTIHRFCTHSMTSSCLYFSTAQPPCVVRRGLCRRLSQLSAGHSPIPPSHRSRSLGLPNTHSPFKNSVQTREAPVPWAESVQLHGPADLTPGTRGWAVPSPTTSPTPKGGAFSRPGAQKCRAFDSTRVRKLESHRSVS